MRMPALCCTINNTFALTFYLHDNQILCGTGVSGMGQHPQQGRGKDWSWDNPSRLGFIDMQSHTFTGNKRGTKGIPSQAFFPLFLNKNILH